MQKTFESVAGRVQGIRAGVKVLGLVAALTAVAPALPDGGVPVETVASAQTGPHKLVIGFNGWKFCTDYACGGAPTCCGPVLF